MMNRSLKKYLITEIEKLSLRRSGYPEGQSHSS